MADANVLSLLPTALEAEDKVPSVERLLLITGSFETCAHRSSTVSVSCRKRSLSQICVGITAINALRSLLVLSPVLSVLVIFGKVMLDNLRSVTKLSGASLD